MMGGWKKAFYNCFDFWLAYFANVITDIWRGWAQFLVYCGIHRTPTKEYWLEGNRPSDRNGPIARCTGITGQPLTLTLVIKQNINWCLQQKRIIAEVWRGQIFYWSSQTCTRSGGCLFVCSIDWLSPCSRILKTALFQTFSTWHPNTFCPYRLILT